MFIIWTIDDTVINANGDSFLSGVLTRMVASTSAGTLLNPSKNSGASINPTKLKSDLSYSFTQKRPNGVPVTTLSLSTIQSIQQTTQMAQQTTETVQKSTEMVQQTTQMTEQTTQMVQETTQSIG